MLFANTMVECDFNGKVVEKVLTRVAHDVEIQSIDWCGFILQALKYSKNSWKRDVPGCYYHGPATFLTVSFSFTL